MFSIFLKTKENNTIFVTVFSRFYYSNRSGIFKINVFYIPSDITDAPL